MADGFYLMHRGWMDNPVFDGEPFGRRDAWIWLIEQAASQPKRIRIRGQLRPILRGQLSHSLRFIAQVWGWHRNRVARFLDELASNDMVRIDSGTGQMVITICNYDQYQDVAPDAGQQRDNNGTISGTAQNICLSNNINRLPSSPRRRRDSNDDKNGTKNKDSSSVSKDTSEACVTRARESTPNQDFVEWWDAYPHKVGKRAAETAYLRALARASPTALIDGVRRYIAMKPPDRQWCNPATFLNQDRHLDQPAMLLPLNGGQHGGSARARNTAHKTLFDAAAELAAEYQHTDRLAG